MKRASYRDGLRWIADNDDTGWLRDPNGIESVTLCLLADLFGVSIKKATADLRRVFLRREK